MNDYEFEDAHNPAMAGADGNKDNGKNDSDDDDDRRTSSARSNFIVRIRFLALLLLLAYSKLYNRVGYCCIITTYNLSYICNKSAIPSASVGSSLRKSNIS